MFRIFQRFLLVFSIGLISVNAQEMSKEDRKVQIYSYEEKANLQNWFNKEVERMKLTEEQSSQYSSVIVYYVAKIARLDDKDQDYTKEEFKSKLNNYLEKQDADLREILSPEQFSIHKEIYGEFLRSAYRRWGIEN
ncbi:MAG: hypothetical protein ACR2MM_11945 [Flavobacteriaceae bacterium]